MRHRPSAAPIADRTRELAREVARWLADCPPDGAPCVSLLEDEIARFCRALHAAGVHGPSVRRLAGAVVREGVDARLPDDARDRTALDAQRLVDVIYLTGAHRGGERVAH